MVLSSEKDRKTPSMLCQGLWFLTTELLIPYIQLVAGSLHQEIFMAFQIQHVFNQISSSPPYPEPNVPPDILICLNGVILPDR